MRILYFFLFIVFIVWSCTSNDHNKYIKENKFKIPYIVQSGVKDSATYFEADSIVVSNPEIVGKYMFSDSITLNDSLFLKDRFEQNFDSLGDGYSSSGLQIFTNYACEINRLTNQGNKIFFPVFVVNETTRDKIIFGVSNYIFAIQEAKDSIFYYPIESGTFGYGCGNVLYWGINIKPNEFLVFLMPKYKGAIKTKIRVRLAASETGIITSAPFEGYINYNQFSIRKNKGLYEWINSVPTPMRVLSLFYGARPPKELNYYPY